MKTSLQLYTPLPHIQHGRSIAIHFLHVSRNAEKVELSAWKKWVIACLACLEVDFWMKKIFFLFSLYNAEIEKLSKSVFHKLWAFFFARVKLCKLSLVKWSMKFARNSRLNEPITLKSAFYNVFHRISNAQEKSLKKVVVVRLASII